MQNDNNAHTSVSCLNLLLLVLSVFKFFACIIHSTHCNVLLASAVYIHGEA